MERFRDEREMHYAVSFYMQLVIVVLLLFNSVLHITGLVLETRKPGKEFIVAVSKRSFKKASASAASPAVDGADDAAARPASIVLPSKKNKPSESLFDYSLVLYGERKIGKTTLAEQFPDNLMIEFEPGARALEAYVMEVQSYAHFEGIVEAILSGQHKFKSTTVDTGGVAYEMAMAYGCHVHDIEHPGAENDYGASWSKIRKVFVDPMRQLLNSGLGFIVIGHEQEKEIETRSGRKFVKMRPNFSKQADEFFTSQIDNIFYYHYDHNERWLQIEGDEYVTAGHRIKGHFLTPKGERVHRIPMGDSEEEAFKNLMAAFNNKQKHTHAPARREEPTQVGSFKRK